MLNRIFRVIDMNSFSFLDGIQTLMVQGGDNLVPVIQGIPYNKWYEGMGINDMKSIGCLHGPFVQVEVNETKSKGRVTSEF